MLCIAACIALSSLPGLPVLKLVVFLLAFLILLSCAAALCVVKQRVLSRTVCCHAPCVVTQTAPARESKWESTDLIASWEQSCNQKRKKPRSSSQFLSLAAVVSVELEPRLFLIHRKPTAGCSKVLTYVASGIFTKKFRIQLRLKYALGYRQERMLLKLLLLLS